VPLGYDFRPTRQPVVLDHWPATAPVGGAFTTIGNWRQAWREVSLDGEVYGWSKHTQFAALLGLPGAARRPGWSWRCPAASADEQEALRRRASRSGTPCPLSRELDPYRAYIAGSRAELTAAKDQNVRLRSGWFSDRSATYLASGRPVITQDTGFGRVLPTGVGLHAWRTLDDAAAAVEAVLADPVGQSRAAREIAEECFDSDRVLGRLLDVLGLPVRAPGSLATAREPGAGAASRLAAGPVAAAPSVPTASVPTASVRAVAVPALPADLPLHAVSRRPLVLPERTLATARSLVYPPPVPGVDHGAPDAAVDVSVVIVCHDGLELTRLCLAGLLADVDAPSFEVLVVDNASTDGTAEDIAELAAADPRVRVLPQSGNLGFAAGVNAGLAQARGQLLVLLNNDTVVPPGRWPAWPVTCSTPRWVPSARSPTAAATRPRSRRPGRRTASW
jgi:hypothetical protein